MLIDFRPHARLRGRHPVDVGAVVSPVIDALARDQADLGRVRIVCDWVQYRENFRDIVDVRPVMSCPAGPPAFDLEIAVDVRRSGGAALADLTSARLPQAPGGPPWRGRLPGELGPGQAELHLGLQRALLVRAGAVGKGVRPELRAGAARR